MITDLNDRPNDVGDICLLYQFIQQQGNRLSHRPIIKDLSLKRQGKILLVSRFMAT